MTKGSKISSVKFKINGQFSLNAISGMFCLSVCLSVCLSICLCLYVCRSVCLSACPIIRPTRHNIVYAFDTGIHNLRLYLQKCEFLNYGDGPEKAKIWLV